MFGFGKKKEQSVVAVADGKVEPITEVTDDVFSQKMMGDGYAIEPSSNEVCSPVSGVVSTVFPTKHAIGITTDKGLEILVHMGLDTVELKGAPFQSQVQEGQSVTKNTLLSKMDVAAIEKSGREATVVVVYTNMDLLKGVPEVSAGNVKHGDVVGSLQYK